MNREELDTLWFQAMRQSIEEGEDFIRYHFAALVAAHEREACARVCDAEVAQINLTSGSRAELVAGMVAGICAAAIRARGEVPR